MCFRERSADLVISRSGLCPKCREERWVEYARGASKLDASIPAPGRIAPTVEKPAVIRGVEFADDFRLTINGESTS